MADLFPDGFIWMPFCPDLDQAIVEFRYTSPKAMADLLPDGFIWTSFCPDLDQAISNTDTLSKNYSRFASRWLYFDTFLSRSGSGHFELRYTFPKLIKLLYS